MMHFFFTHFNYNFQFLSEDIFSVPELFPLKYQQILKNNFIVVKCSHLVEPYKGAYYKRLKRGY